MTGPSGSVLLLPPQHFEVGPASSTSRCCFLKPVPCSGLIPHSCLAQIRPRPALSRHPELMNSETSSLSPSHPGCPFMHGAWRASLCRWS